MTRIQDSRTAVAPAKEHPAEIIERAAYELPSVDGAFLFDPEGSVLATAGVEAANDAAVLALTSGLLQLADRTASELGRGGLRHIAVQGQVGYLVASALDSGHLLVLLGRQDARLGLLLHDLDILAERLAPGLN